MLGAIAGAVESVCLESYIFAPGRPGDDFRAALVTAARRGVRVRVLVDALGSMNLADAAWAPLREAGGEVRWFNPLALRRLGIRDHRKLLVCDERTAFIGGFNIAPEYLGDGVHSGWRDLALRVTGPLAAQLAAAFDRMFALAELRHKRFPRLRKPHARRSLAGEVEHLFLSAPGRGGNPYRRALLRDLKSARSVRIMVPYFLPPWRLRRALQRVARRGGRVQLILPGRSDVAVAQLAARSLYARLLRAGVELYEYQPQMLHAKLLLVDGVAYVGSANLDPRSLHWNYELMLRVTDTGRVGDAADIYAETLAHCRRIEPAEWRRARSLWTRVKERWSHFLLARVDPWLAMRQWRALAE